jgi:hypothetical protein
LLIKNNVKEVIAIMESDGHTRFDENHPALVLLVTKNRVYFRPPVFQFYLMKKNTPTERPIYEKSFNELPDGVFDGKTWVHETPLLFLKWGVILSIFPLLLFFLFSFSLIFLVAFTGIFQLYAKMIFKLNLLYATVSRLMIVASTPCMLLLSALAVTNQAIPGIYILLFILFVFYVSCAFIFVRSESQKMVRL